MSTLLVIYDNVSHSYSQYPGVAGVAHKWISALDQAGAGTLTQPAAADLSDGTTGSGQVVLASSAVITLNVGTNVGLTSPGAMTLGNTYTIGNTGDNVQLGTLGLGAANLGGATSLTISQGGNSGITLGAANNYIGGNFYYNSGFKYAANGYAGQILFSNSAGATINFNVAANNAGGAGASLTPINAGAFASTGGFIVGDSGTDEGLGTVNVKNSYYITGTPALTLSAGYVVFGSTSAGVDNVIIGQSSDHTNYYKSNTHLFRDTSNNIGCKIGVSYILPTETTFANRPASPVTGMLCNFSDANTVVWGATIAGSGTNHVLGRYNGTNWTVVGV